HAVVFLPVRILGPGVEAKAHNDGLTADDGLTAPDPLAAAPASREDRPEVARPAAIRRKAKEGDTGQINPGFREHAPRLRFVGFGVDDNVNALGGREPARDLAVDPLD